MTELQQFVSVAESLAKKAGDLCLELQGNLGDVKYKFAKPSRRTPSVPRKQAWWRGATRVTAGLSTR